MSATVQLLLAGVLVVVATLFALWRLLPVRARLPLLERLQRLPADGRFPVGVLQRWAARHAVLASGSSGCGNCASHTATARRPHG
jgi:hypothetical protein